MWASGEAASASTSASTATSTASTNGRRSSTTGVWGFDGGPFDASTPPSTTAAASTASAAIGGGFVYSHVSKSRLLWNRTAPEEEEREEEALPSYLTYLQPAFRGSSTSTSERIPHGTLGVWGDEAPTSSLSATSSLFVPAASFGALSPAAGAFSPAASYTSSTPVEAKSKELALALQDFVRQQVEASHQQRVRAASGASATSSGPCNCEPLKMRVSDLEQRLLALQQQIGALVANNGAATGVPSHANGPPGIVGPPPPGLGMLSTHPPLPPTPPPSGGFQTALDSPSAAASAITDRVSTLEGRQSAFQSQLAQISKVLGVPIGKHGKNSQIKNLVQTLREEIDAKFQMATKEVEAKCVAAVAQQVEQVVAKAVEERLQDPNAASPHSQLPYDAVFGALAEEHEASLGKLSAYFEERLGQESKQRVGLESRIQSRFGEHEEWLQQLEGEFGSWHDRSSTVASQLRVIQNKINEMDEKWKAEQLKWSKLASDIQLGSVNQPQASQASTVSVTATTTTSVETLTRSVHQLQTQYKQFHSEYKTETSELRENLVLMDTWVKTSRQETRDLGKSVKGMKQLVEKLVRDTGSAEELLQQYVSTITHQVASVTRQYVSVRIRDNNRLIDATLRARVPAYVDNESENFMLVRPEKKNGADEIHAFSASIVIKEDDEEGIQKLLKQHVEDAAAASARTSSESSGASSSPIKK